MLLGKQNGYAARTSCMDIQHGKLSWSLGMQHRDTVYIEIRIYSMEIFFFLIVFGGPEAPFLFIFSSAALRGQP